MESSSLLVCGKGEIRKSGIRKKLWRVLGAVSKSRVKSPQRKLGDHSSPVYIRDRQNFFQSPQRKLGDRSSPALRQDMDCSPDFHRGYPRGRGPAGGQAGFANTPNFRWGDAEGTNRLLKTAPARVALKPAFILRLATRLIRLERSGKNRGVKNNVLPCWNMS
jgi:hypothetical protein